MKRLTNATVFLNQAATQVLFLKQYLSGINKQMLEALNRFVSLSQLKIILVN